MPSLSVVLAAAPAQGPEVPAGVRRLVPAAFILLLTSFWLPWWGVRHEVVEAQGTAGFHVGLFQGHHYVVDALTHAGGALLAVAAFLLFLRTAAQSSHHEPGKYRRDLFVASGLVVVALLLTGLWPLPHPRQGFWTTLEFTDPDTGIRFRETARPLLGWWTALAGALAAGAATVWAWRARPGGDRRK